MNMNDKDRMFITANTPLPVYIIFPRFLLDTQLPETAMLVYILLLDRTRLSLTNEAWIDRQGRAFVYFTIANLAETMHKSETTIKNSLVALQEANLIYRKRQGQGKPSIIYVKVPTDIATFSGSSPCSAFPDTVKPDTEKPDTVKPNTENPDTVKTDLLTDKKRTFGQMGNRLLDRQVFDLETGGNLAANNNDNSKNHKLKSTQPNRGIKNPLSSYGTYGNVLLSDEDLKALQREYPYDWSKWIEDLSYYMASTGTTYQNHLATLRRWARKEAERNMPKRYVYDRFPRTEEDSL